MMRSATLHTASIAPTISCFPTTTSSSRHSSCAVTPGSTRAGSACLRTPNSDKPVSVGTMCFPWATRKPCFFRPPLRAQRQREDGPSRPTVNTKGIVRLPNFVPAVFFFPYAAELSSDSEISVAAAMNHQESVRVLASLFRASNEARPLLLLGAGASFSSGVPLASESVRRIARRVYAEKSKAARSYPNR